LKALKVFSMRAFVFINTELGFRNDVQRRLDAIDGVEETHLLYGKYDIMAIVNANSLKWLKDVVGWKIRVIPHIRVSQTLMAMNDKSELTSARASRGLTSQLHND
jgi:DNA-binding Lrp family transcriptional regulator